MESHFTANLLPLAFLEKFRIFFRKTHLFFQKNLNFERFEKFYYFSLILRQVCYLWRFWKNSIFSFEEPINFFEKNRILNVLRNFTILVAFYGKLATFSDFEKIRYFFRKNPSVFLKTQILNVLRNFTILLAFYGKFPTFSDPKKFRYFFSKNRSILLKKAQFLNVLRKFTFWVAFYGKFATFGDFEKIQNFVSKNPSIFLKKIKLWTFSEILLLRSHFASNLLPSAISKKFNVFLKNPSIFFKKTQTLNVLRNFIISVAFYGKFASFSDFEKIQYFFSKNQSIFLKKPKFWTLWENLPFESHFTANLLPWRFWKNSDFFSKNPFIFFKKTQTLNVLRNFTISVAFYIKLAFFGDFEKTQ